MLQEMLGRFNQLRAARVCARSRQRDAFADVPPELFGYWQKTARTDFPGIPLDRLFFANATEGLLTFFACVRGSAAPCALPSMAADSVWHAWNESNARGLDAFCSKHYGQVIAHVEAARMQGEMGSALAACLIGARRLEGLQLAGPNLPRLFALDRILRMPHGFGYRIARGKVAYARLNEQGREHGTLHFPAALAPDTMLAAGLLPLAAYTAARRDGDGAACGTGSVSSSGDVSCDSDSSSCDGGSSCGSSCGGGGCGSS